MAAVFCNLIGGQDELVFEGDSFALNCEGKISARAKQFSEDFLVIECDENKNLLTSRIERQNCFEGEIYSALVLGLRDYFIKNNFSRAVLGLSGGIDSAVSLAIAVEAVGKENVKAIMMQTEFTSASSLADARECAMNFNIEFDEIPIQVIFDLVRDSLKSVFEGKVEEITKENLQSRIRGVLLMAISNNENRLLISTGNKSEIAVGYSTLYGDMCGSFCVLKDIFKTDVYKLARFINSKGVNKQNKALIPNNILLKSPSAELKFDQVDEDSLPPYNILDDILRRFIEENQSAEVIINSGHSGDSVGQVLQLLKNSEFKRKQASPGVKISPTGFGRDWRFPITNSFSFNRSAT